METAGGLEGGFPALHEYELSKRCRSALIRDGAARKTAQPLRCCWFLIWSLSEMPLWFQGSIGLSGTAWPSTRPQSAVGQLQGLRHRELHYSR